MKEIVPKNLIRSYLESRTNSYDDFLLLRRTISYQYGSLSCLSYALGLPLELQNFFINLVTGNISISSLPLFKTNPHGL